MSDLKCVFSFIELKVESEGEGVIEVLGWRLNAVVKIFELINCFFFESSQAKSRRKIEVSLGEELDNMNVPRIIDCDNLRTALAHRGLVVQAGGSSKQQSSADSRHCCPSPTMQCSSEQQQKSVSPQKLPFNLLIAGRGDTRRSEMVRKQMPQVFV